MVNDWELLLSLVMATVGGVGAAAAYGVLTVRALRGKRHIWATYFSILLVSESLITILFAVGLSTQLGLPSASLPIWLTARVLLFAVPVSVGSSALGWLAFARMRSETLRALTMTTAKRVNTLIEETVRDELGM